MTYKNNDYLAMQVYFCSIAPMALVMENISTLEIQLSNQVSISTICLLVYLINRTISCNASLDIKAESPFRKQVRQSQGQF